MRTKSIFRGFIILFPFFFFSFFPRDASAAIELEQDRKEKIVEAAKQEGNLLWYGALNIETANRLVERFQKKYPFINTKLYRAGDQAMLTRILAEADAKKNVFDVVAITEVIGETLKRKGLFAKYLSPESKFYSAGSKDPDGYWTDTYVDLNVVSYNTKLVPPGEVPNSWDDLLKPQWKGKMGMDTKPFVWFAYMLKIMGEKNGLEYMKKLSEQNIKFRTGRSLNSQMVAAGEVAICLTDYSQNPEKLKPKGASIDWIAVDPQRVIPSLHPMGISAYAPHPNAAKLFYDFILSAEGQKIYVDSYVISSRVDINPISPRLRQGIKIVPFNSSIVDNYDKYVKLFRDIFLKK